MIINKNHIMLLTSKDKEYIINNYPLWKITSDNIIEWILRINASYDEKSKKLLLNEKSNNFIDKSYKIKIELDNNKFPEVYEIWLDLQRWLDYHIYPNWKLCLTYTLFEDKYKNKDFEYLLKHFIIPFLYNQSYFIDNWKWILWEYWHWFEWTFEFVLENNIWKDDYKLILKSIKQYIKNNLKLFLYSNIEQKNLIKLLNLESKKSIKGFYSFIDYLKKHTNLFTKI